MAKSKLVRANQKLEERVIGGYKKIENTVVSGYKKIEDKFVDQYLTREGESIEDAKKRLKSEQVQRQHKHDVRQVLHRQKIAEKHAK